MLWNSDEQGRREAFSLNLLERAPKHYDYINLTGSVQEFLTLLADDG
jgi:hypothetical protein